MPKTPIQADQVLFDISNEEINLTLTKPDRTENVSGGPLVIHLRKFNRDHRSFLMIGRVDANLDFIYWIPGNLVTGAPLVSILKTFVQLFGVKLKVAETEGYLLLNVMAASHGQSFKDIFQYSEQYRNVDISIHAGYGNPEQIGDILKYQFWHCFAINHFKYLTWLRSIQKTPVQVASHLFDSLKEFVDCLNPDGSSRITILRNRIGDSDSPAPKEEKLFLHLPSVYRKRFEYLAKLIDERAVNDSVRVILDNTKKTCFVCGKDDLSKEHIFPRWHRAFFPSKKLRMGHAAVTLDVKPESVDNARLDEKVEDSYGVTIDRICVECNTTWLSQLEDEVKEIFVRHTGFAPNIKALKLDNLRKYNLSRWVVVKAILLSLKYHYPLENNVEFLKLLRNGTIPAGFVVEIAEEDTSDVSFLLQQGLEDARVGLYDGYDLEAARSYIKGFLCVVVKFGNFIFRVTYLRPGVGLYRIAHGKETSVLFPSQDAVSYIENPFPKAQLQTMSPEAQFFSFLKYIAISSKKTF